MTSRTRHVCFTYLNPPLSLQDYFDSIWDDTRVNYLVIGDEVSPTTGTPHFQGYIEIKNGKTAKSWKKHLGNSVHFEARFGTPQQAADYCKKDGEFLERGELSEQGHRTDLDEAIDVLREHGLEAVAVSHPRMVVLHSRGLQQLSYFDLRAKPRDPPLVELLLGPTGCGKTRFTNPDRPGACKVDVSKSWFDPYIGQEHLIIDDYTGTLPLCSLLQYLDRYRCTVPVKGSAIPLAATRISITSNIHPRYWYNWHTRETQYSALIRRLGRVLYWTTNATEPLELKPGHHLWDTFVKGPDAFANPIEYYDFINE